MNTLNIQTPPLLIYFAARKRFYPVSQSISLFPPCALITPFAINRSVISECGSGGLQRCNRTAATLIPFAGLELTESLRLLWTVNRNS